MHQSQSSPLTPEGLTVAFGPELMRLAQRLTGHRADAEDLVQEAYVRALRALPGFTYNGPGSVHAWVRRITTNIFLDQARRRSRLRIDPFAEGAEEQAAAVSEGPEASYERAHLDVDVAKALAALPPDYRAAVVLCDLEGLSYQEVAEILGCKLGTVRSRIHRGRTLLREALPHRAPRGQQPSSLPPMTVLPVLGESR
ncbi:sigma-70 family RNA polymerase sigma factor [Galactobacter sp.]|uniref:sigma-70 family RNA polymerase sigma factor n=1 Tax=Galactobacter sp. TaxID=2676125 RepID=UPI0025BB18BC|nr:sigma-70 family RNA polymerase sigma factor [Galactobacter sp.]